MLLSMTGFGEATVRGADGVGAVVEIKAVNNRHFKLNVKYPDGYAAWESEIEALVRPVVKRGTVQLSLRLERSLKSDDFRLNLTALASYREQLLKFCQQVSSPEQVRLEHLLGLPGVVEDDRSRKADLEAEWPVAKQAIEAALAGFQAMREKEGAAMAEDLRLNAQKISVELEKIAERAPVLVETFRTKLLERLNKVLVEHQIQLEPADVIREISVFTERSDVSEEIVRLRSHLGQLAALRKDGDGAGRKLDFLIQEMFRETNTIGSKSSDIEVSQRVVEIKALIERLREMVQNVE